MRNFNLSGTKEENFQKLEKIMPRIIKRLGTKTYGIIPSSVLHAYQEVVPDTGLIFRCCLFAGKVKKISFLIASIDGTEKPKYQCVIKTSSDERIFTFETKKQKYTQEINMDVSDGDTVEVRQILSDTAPILSGIHISVLFQLQQKDNEVKEQLISHLLDEEGIANEEI